MKKTAAASVLAAALLSASAFALEDGPFTGEQSRTGRALYVANCAACHGPELKGAGEAPPLAGTTFMAAWGKRSTEELYNLVKASMPYGNGNSLDADVYRRIVAYVLAANGAKPGNIAMVGNETVQIARIADGKMPVMAEAPAAAAARPATSYPATRFGLTVAGALKNFDPVTDAMLAHPKDADWLMYRRNYQGWSHSPLAAGDERQREGTGAAMVLGDE